MDSKPTLFPFNPHKDWGISLSVRLIHQTLQVKSHVNTWFKSKVEQLNLIEGKDYSYEARDVHVTLYTAVRLVASAATHIKALDNLFRHYTNETAAAIVFCMNNSISDYNKTSRNLIENAANWRVWQARVQIGKLADHTERAQQMAVLNAEVEKDIAHGKANLEAADLALGKALLGITTICPVKRTATRKERAEAYAQMQE